MTASGPWHVVLLAPVMSAQRHRGLWRLWHVMTTERHLLFTVLAFENELIDLVQLTLACRDWAADKSQSMAEMLVARGWLTARDRQFLESIVERKLARHQHDP